MVRPATHNTIKIEVPDAQVKQILKLLNRACVGSEILLSAELEEDGSFLIVDQNGRSILADHVQLSTKE